MSTRQSPEEILEALRLPLMQKLAQYPDYGSFGFEVSFHQGRPVRTEWRIQEKLDFSSPAEEINRVSSGTKTVTPTRRSARVRV